MRKALLILTLLPLTFRINAQEIEWQNTIGGSLTDFLYNVKACVDGGYICGGSSESNISGDKSQNAIGEADYWIVKLDSSGNIQWQKTIGGNGIDNISTILQTGDGGFVCGGWSDSNISGDKTENSQGGSDYWIVKLDMNGIIQWQNTIGGKGLDFLNSLEQTSDGGYICGGSSNSGISGDKSENTNGLDDYWIVKIDSLGNIQWENTVGGLMVDRLNAIQQTFDGGYICGGTSESDISGDKLENSRGIDDFWVIKLDMNGSLQWQKTIGGNDYDLLHSLRQTVDGGYICGGESISNSSGEKSENSQGGYDYWVVKLDTAGNIQWQNTIGGDGFDGLQSIKSTNGGGFICGGMSSSNISGDKFENSIGGLDYWVVKLDNAGQLEWQNTIGGLDNDWLNLVESTSTSEYICGGWSESNISGDKT
ncbi:MAG: T9SS C-terminal target domain-containing protein [Bacteroidetes bacterium]|nr:T9SS C-terminal target domain-containing protein [Bacteroidota bacterium]